MSRQRLFFFVSAAASVSFWAYACGDGPTDPPPDTPRPTTVTVSPATAELAALGATVRLSAEVKDQNGQVMAGASVTWTSSATAVATVDASGLVTAVVNGTATITATAGEASGSATVTVEQVPAAIALTPGSAAFSALGDTATLEASATDANGHVINGAGVQWSSSDATIAQVSSAGLVTSAGNGSTTITATADEASGSATVTVEQVPAAVALTPDSAAFSALGDTATLEASVTDTNGHVINGTGVQWSSNDATIVRIRPGW